MNLKLGLTLLTLVVLVACKSLTPVMNIDNYTLPKTTNIETVEKAILSGAASRGWQPIVKKPGHIVASINVRNKHQAVVDIYYNEQAYSVKYKDSMGLKYEPRSGKIHPNYNNWMNHLKNSINAAFYSN